jgi:hypothetical protein
MWMEFEIIGNITDIEAIAAGYAIRELTRLRKMYGQGRWRKLKGIATMRLLDDTIHTAELHWHEASDIGRREIKIKYLLTE